MAVYTDVSDEALEAFLQAYAIGGLVSFKGIAEGVENSNYLLRTETGSFILTLYEKRVNSADLPYFLNLLQFLNQKDLSCPMPCPQVNGTLLGELETKPAAIFTFLDGFSIKKARVDHCYQLGEVLAKLHLAGQGFDEKRENALGVASWRALFQLSGKRADSVLSGLYDSISNRLDWIEKNWPQSLPTGVIHADLFPDNVFFLKNHLSGLIDFYFACNDLLAYDLAICINAWCFEPDFSFNITKAQALLRGYESYRPLQDEEKEALPVLASGAALRFLLTRLYDWLEVPEGALVTPHDPIAFWRRLEFHKDVRSVVEYGL